MSNNLFKLKTRNPDEEDEWYIEHGMEKMIALEETSNLVGTYIKSNIISIVGQMIEMNKKNNDVVNMGLIYVVDGKLVDEYDYRDGASKNINNLKLKLPKDKVAVGLISLDWPDREEGHWAAYYYDPRANRAIIYDSMQNNKNTRKNFDSYSKHSNVFKSSLAIALGIGNINITIAGCPCGGRRSSSASKELVELARNIRPANISRQPTGGSINNAAVEKLYKNLKITKPPSTDLRKEISSYQSQHQFCYIEALMFLNDMMRDKNNMNVCHVDKQGEEGKVALSIAKKFMNEIVFSKKYNLSKEPPNEFNRNRDKIRLGYIFNPNSRNANKINNFVNY